MSTTTEARGDQQPGVPSAAPIQLETAIVRSWKAPIALAIFTVISFLLSVVAGRDGTTGFRLNTDVDVIQLPVIALPTPAIIAVLVVVLLGLGVLSWWLVRIKRPRLVFLAVLVAFLLSVAVLPSLVTVRRGPRPSSSRWCWPSSRRWRSGEHGRARRPGSGSSRCSRCCSCSDS